MCGQVWWREGNDWSEDDLALESIKVVMNEQQGEWGNPIFSCINSKI